MFLKGLVRLQAFCRAVRARKLLRVMRMFPPPQNHKNKKIFFFRVERNVAYRENVAREIHKTEADYIKSLNVLIEV